MTYSNNSCVPQVRREVMRFSAYSLPGVEESEPVGIPSSFELHQNYPNPFNPTTTIEFALPKSSFVTLKVMNLIGQEIATLVSSELPAGTHRIVWDAGGFPSGIYFYQLEAVGFKTARKMLLLK